MSTKNTHPFKRSVGFQEKHAVAMLHENQMRLPFIGNQFVLTVDGNFIVERNMENLLWKII
jgi:hypothetical protein